MPDTLSESIECVPDEELWAMRGGARQHVVQIVREHLATQLRERGLEAAHVNQAESVLDPNSLTIGFARRFTEYKRPNLLLSDLARLSRLLLDDNHPIQIVAAGKAHPADPAGKAMIKEWINLAREPRYRRRVVFLEDYDISLAQELVQGVDVWINTPRRPWEACGTSGMKVLVNGGLNFSVRDGWWDEAYAPNVGWAIGDGRDGEAGPLDAQDAASLYDTLEQQIIPEFYDRDAAGLPRAWLKRIRRSMSVLTPKFSSTRMVSEYVESAYLPLAEALRTRLADGCAKAKTLDAQRDNLKRHWPALHIGDSTMIRAGDAWHFSVPVFLGEISPDEVRVEVFAKPLGQSAALTVPLNKGDTIPGAAHGYIYCADIASSRPAEHFTVRIVPHNPDAFIPAEMQLIRWQK